jgi:ATP-dependent DNA helicase RecG
VTPRRAIATPEEEARLAERRRSASLPFDARPVAGSSTGDLSLDRFTLDLLPQLVAPDVLEANRRSVEHQLAAVRFTDAAGVPTPTGLLVVGIDPQAWIRGAYVQFLRVDGTDLAGDVLSEHRLTGPLPDLLRELEEVLRAHIDTVDPPLELHASPTFVNAVMRFQP